MDRSSTNHNGGPLGVPLRRTTWDSEDARNGRTRDPEAGTVLVAGRLANVRAGELKDELLNRDGGSMIGTPKDLYKGCFFRRDFNKKWKEVKDLKTGPKFTKVKVGKHWIEIAKGTGLQITGPNRPRQEKSN